MLGKKAGLADAEIIDIRRRTSQQPMIGALVRFVGAALHPQARVSDDQLNALRAAGYSDAQITDVLLVIAQTVFTNLFNRVHQTTLDFPPAASL
jgi:hypothetical protein